MAVSTAKRLIGFSTVRFIRVVQIAFLTASLCVTGSVNALDSPVFSDDFESGLERWDILDMRSLSPLAGAATIVDSGDAKRGKVLSLKAGQGIALIKGSEAWTNYSFEGNVYFPDGNDSLMGLVYHLNELERSGLGDETHPPRIEFGSIYIKCGGSYVRINPHYDGTAGRALYDDYKTPLTGVAAVSVGRWQHFRYEVLGGKCHLYVGYQKEPHVTYHGFHLHSGRVGLRPRSVGSACWIDNVRIAPLAELSFKGNVRGRANTDPAQLLTDWTSLGPFSAPMPDIEAGTTSVAWQPFSVDPRGCIVSGRICDFQAPGRKIAYFRTDVNSDKGDKALLRFSSRSPLEVFLNGESVGTVKPVAHIWPDFWKVKRHVSSDLPLELKPGENNLIVRVHGGTYPGCGFYARLEKGE